MTIYSQKIAGHLMVLGFVLQGMGKDKRNDRKNVFFFKDSEELRKALKELIKK